MAGETAQKSAHAATTRPANIKRLNMALKARDQTEIINATRAEAQRLGFNLISRRAGMSRSTLHAALGPRGNPTLATILRVGKAMGLDFAASDSGQVRDG